jgi:methylated-DNA-[protein]-cysteine S-methyltransferase
MPQLSYNSPVGPLSLFEDDGFIVALDWGWPAAEEPTPLLERARDQLHAYFSGTLKEFDLPLKPCGTDYQRKVWTGVATIPYGKTLTYGLLAKGLTTGARSVGTALGRNPIPIIIPCHRVVGSSGGLGGYSGWDGVDTKRFLLTLEGAL